MLPIGYIMKPLQQSGKLELERERSKVLKQWEDLVEIPMLVMGFIWLGLFIIEIAWGLNPLLEAIGVLIWIVFIIDFSIKLILIPHKLFYLKDNWLIALSLLIPALRTLRIAQFVQSFRAVRGLQLIRVMLRTSRGIQLFSASVQRRGFGYGVGLTTIVTLMGAAGIYAFERDLPSGEGINDYATALWWTAMIMTTIGSDYSPKTSEGRILCFLLALYAVSVFGYVTAAVATFFIDQDVENNKFSGEKSVQALQIEIKALRSDIQELAQTKPVSDNINS